MLAQKKNNKKTATLNEEFQALKVLPLRVHDFLLTQKYFETQAELSQYKLDEAVD